MQKNIVENIYDIISKGVKSGIGQIYTEDEFYDKTTIFFGNKIHVNFGSYSYLGLEHDSRLKEGAKDAITRYGIQYPSSRTYMSSTPYKEYEKLLEQIFQAPVVIATTTTLAHVAAMPIIVSEGDVIIMDQQVHSSVQFMISHLQLQGVPFHLVRHNNLANLEKQIIELSQKYDKVWYMLDGIYSMYGDVAPMKELEVLLNKHPKLHLYVDDAHGMSWCGERGMGYALSEIDLHERMILVTSLNKAYAAGGAVLVIPDIKLRDKVKTCGGPFIFAGQHQMSALGAGIACAKIHLSDDIYALQRELAAKIAHCQKELESYGLPIVSSPESPIFFIGVGLPRVGYNLVKKMIDSGQYVNLAIFPAVAETRTGVRFTITSNHSYEQITEMARILSINFQQTLVEEERSLQDIHHAFRRVLDFKQKKQNSLVKTKVSSNFIFEQFESISQVPENLWNSLLGKETTFDWKGLLSLEQIFSKTRKAHEKWKFHYYLVKDESGKPVLATYFTVCLTKDDALAPASVSEEIEQKRLSNHTYLCSKTLMMGSPISVGKHLYLDKTHQNWKGALMYFTENLWKQHELSKANVLNLRDFHKDDPEIKPFFADQGFITVDMLDDYSITGIKPFNLPAEYLSQLKSSQRYFVKKRAIEKSHMFKVEILNGSINKKELDHLYELYLDVNRKSFELNMFTYPKELFKTALVNDNWEVLSLTLSDNNDKKPVAIAISIRTEDRYNFLIAGLDYDVSVRYDTYSQLLWQLVLRANALGLSNIGMGLTTGQNKRKFGAKAQSNQAFLQIKDNFNASIVSSMSNREIISIKTAKTLKAVPKT